MSVSVQAPTRGPGTEAGIPSDPAVPCHKACDIRKKKAKLRIVLSSNTDMVAHDGHMNGSNGNNGTIGDEPTNGISKSPKLLWQHPSPGSTPMSQFMHSVNQKYGLQLSSYEELHKWSIDHIDKFWGRVWQFVGVRAHSEASRVSLRKSNVKDRKLIDCRL